MARDVYLVRGHILFLRAEEQTRPSEEGIVEVSGAVLLINLLARRKEIERGLSSNIKEAYKKVGIEANAETRIVFDSGSVVFAALIVVATARGLGYSIKALKSHAYIIIYDALNVAFSPDNIQNPPGLILPIVDHIKHEAEEVRSNYFKMVVLPMFLGTVLVSIGIILGVSMKAALLHLLG